MPIMIRTPHHSDPALHNTYWEQTRQPFCCLVFLTPLLVLYEAGVLWLGGRHPDAIRNGADHWMRDALARIGLSQELLLPALVLIGLLVWHLVGRYRWRLSPDALGGMLAESLLFAFLLVVVGQLADALSRQMGVELAIAGHQREMATRTLGFVGAGIYEEVLFRLLMLPAAYGLFRLARLEKGGALLLAAATTGLLFSLAHYIGPAGDPFHPFSFAFRAVAGFFFAGLFVLRGFGITVGAHAAYDLLVGMLLTS